MVDSLGHGLQSGEAQQHPYPSKDRERSKPRPCVCHQQRKGQHGCRGWQSQMFVGPRGGTKNAMETGPCKSLEVGRRRGFWVSLHLRVKNYDSVLLELSVMTNTALTTF